MKLLLRAASRLLLVLLPAAAFAQTPGVGIGTTAPDASAALDIVSSSKGALLPRVANATAIANPATGLIVFQTSAPAGFYYNAGTAGAPSWQQLGTTTNGDNLGNHTATQNLNLGANKLVGTGASISGVGVGIRADGGLNLGQNTVGNGVYLGYLAGRFNTGGGNTFSGYSSGASNTTGANNTFSGASSGYSNTAGSNNVFSGLYSGVNNTTGSGNVFTGRESGSSSTTGNDNVFSGHYSGYYNTSGNNNTALGAFSGPANGSGGITNATAIGANVALTTSNTVVLGNGASVGIGTSAPATTLDVRTSDGSAAITVGSTNATDGGLYLGNPNHGVQRNYNGNGNSVGLYTTAGDVYLSANGPGNSDNFVLQNGGNVGIGTNGPSQKLDVNGNLRVRGLSGTGTRLLAAQADGTLGTNNSIFSTSPNSPGSFAGAIGSTGTDNQPYGIAVVGTKAYVVYNNSASLQIFDLSATTPALLSTLPLPNGTAVDVAVSGTTAFVTTRQNGGMLVAVDVSTPTAPVVSGTLVTGNDMFRIALKGTKAYLAGASNLMLQIVDVSNPAAMSLLSTTSAGLSVSTIGVAVNAAGTRAYVTDTGSSVLNVYDVSTPTSPTLLGSIGTDVGPYDVAVSGTTAYVINIGSNTLQIFDVSNPAAMTVLGSIGTGAFPARVTVNGSRAFVACHDDSQLQVIDVSNPAAPTQVSSSPTTGQPTAVAVNGSGSMAYVVNEVSNTLQVFGYLPPRTVAVNADGTLASVAMSSTVAGAGLSSTTAGSVTTIQLGGSALTAATSVPLGGNNLTFTGTGNVGIGNTAAITQKLEVTGGNIKIASAGSGLIFPDGSTQTTAATATGFIQNRTTQQASSNFNISGAGTVGGLLTAGSATVTGATNINTGTSTGATNIGTGSAAGAVTIGRSGGTVTVPKLTTAGIVTTDASGNLSSASTASFGTNFIQNQTTQQASSNFNISGSGTIGGDQTVAGNAYVNGGLGVVLNGQDRPLITRGYDAFTSGSYSGAGRWGLFMEPSTLTFGVPALASRNFQWATYNAGSTINATLMTLTQGGSLGIGASSPTQVLDVNGGILARGNTAISNQGAYLQWNRTGGDGETWLLNQQGGGSGNAGIRFGGATTANAVTEWARFLNNGNFGIGTTSPNQKLEVTGTAAPTTAGTTGLLRLSRPTTSGVKWPNTFDLALGSYASGINSQTRVDFNLGDGANGNADQTVLTLQGNGNVGVGTTSPGQKLEVNGNVLVNSSYDIFLRDTNHGLGWYGGTSKTFGGAAPDGPALYGYGGGLLGTNQSGSHKTALYWNRSNQVGIGTTSPISTLSLSSVTAQSNTASQTIGELSFVGFNRPAASASILSQSPGWDDAGYLIFKTSTGSSGALERMRLTETGLSITSGEKSGSIGAGVFLSGGTTGNADMELRGGTPYIDFAANTGTDYSSRLLSTTDALNFYVGASTVPVMTLLGNTSSGVDRMGIGTTSPIAPLHVKGAALAATVGGGFSFFNPGSGLTATGVPANQTKAVTAYFESGEVWVNSYIVAAALQTTSDRRIKRVLGLSDRSADLALLNRLRITDYTYIDQVNNTPGVVKKVIAQEVEEVLPAAVSRSTQALPNVYERATKVSFANGQVTVTMSKPHELPASGGRLRLYTPGNEELNPEVSVVDARTVRFASPKAYAEGLFVYGKFVDDFRSVDYDALTTLNVSATQELARKVAALEAENAALKAQAAADKAQASADKNQATATLEAIEARLRRLEAQGEGQARK